MILNQNQGQRRRRRRSEGGAGQWIDKGRRRRRQEKKKTTLQRHNELINQISFFGPKLLSTRESGAKRKPNSEYKTCVHVCNQYFTATHPNTHVHTGTQKM